MTRPTWFLDWTGESVAIVASGPSTKKVSYALLEGRIKTIAVKENIDICPWAEVLYGCDRAYWRNCQGKPDYKGLKISYSPPTTDIHAIKIDEPNDQILTAEPGKIGSGGNSGFQALNIAVQFGATRILLVGFDMSSQHDVHWFGRSNGDGRTNPGEYNFKRWRIAFNRAAVQLQALGVKVLNASPCTSLTCFPVVTVEAALKEWRL